MAPLSLSWAAAGGAEEGRVKSKPPSESSGAMPGGGVGISEANVGSVAAGGGITGAGATGGGATGAGATGRGATGTGCGGAGCSGTGIDCIDAGTGCCWYVGGIGGAGAYVGAGGWYAAGWYGGATG
ncbi:hypothetical protein GCM10027610_130390 [Dactylosporangium cerinum]